MKLYPKIKMWLVNEKGESIIGVGLAELLGAIDKYGSIHEASSHLNMSYRYALHRIKLAESRLGFKLVERRRGGIRGGGASLTKKGKILLEKFSELKNKINKFTMLSIEIPEN